MTGSRPGPSSRRANRSFWLLLAVSILAAGAVGDALADDPSQVTGLRLAASGLLLVVSVALAARVLLSVDRARARARGTPTASSRPRRRRERPAT